VNYEAPWSAGSLQAKAVRCDRLGFFRFWGDQKRINHPSPVRFARELWMAGKKGETTVANGNNGNQFRDDEIIRLRQRLRTDKMAKRPCPRL
jgi:hypothetical protein